MIVKVYDEEQQGVTRRKKSEIKKKHVQVFFLLFPLPPPLSQSGQNHCKLLSPATCSVSPTHSMWNHFLEH